MDTSISRSVRADPRRIFALAAAVEDWPRILPHYRWVRVVDCVGAGRRIVDMAARRDITPGVGVPLHWMALQQVLPDQRRVDFEHVWGITRGMRVAWTIEPFGGTSEVTIRHVFEPSWPAPALLVRAIVGEYFVNSVARRTLWRIAELAELRTNLGEFSGLTQES